jgi:outer membrane murein-binding lipoprotein Lpp
MRTRTKLLLVLAVLLAGAALVSAGVSRERVRRLSTRARIAVTEQHVADLGTDHESLEAQVHALAARVAALEARLSECGCPPPPPPVCEPCTCAEGGGTCGHDADGDGTDDCLDKCPCEPGPPENTGCPGPICRICDSCEIVPCGHDADGDGLDDCQDFCPCRPGPADHQGCPVGDVCQNDADCDDGNGCSADICDHGTCRHECLCLGPAGFDCCPGPVAECPPPGP